MRQDDEALEAFKKALESDPKGGQVYNNLGYLYHRRGELEQAVEMYERATQRTQDTSAAWSNLGNALYEMRRADEAMNAWKRALELDPSNDKASRALERLGLEATD
jgi:Tfp pilus assembly protein PilF